MFAARRLGGMELEKIQILDHHYALAKSMEGTNKFTTNLLIWYPLGCLNNTNTEQSCEQTSPNTTKQDIT